LLKSKHILLSIVILLLNVATTFSQKDTCTFILADLSLKDVTVHPNSNTYYLACNINNWNPKDSSFRFSIDKNGIPYLKHVFDKATALEFKFTRGSWDNAECDSLGNDINNRVIRTDTSHLQIYYIKGWKHIFSALQKKHTASSNVHIIDTAFYIPQLNRTRRIWIYLPADYATNGKHYPVMYMQDGQNLFDDYTSGYGEWGIDECIDTLIQQGQPPCIIVGIDCGEKRVNEYNPYSNDRFGKGEGNLYVDFLFQTLKPFIDNHYRTLPAKENTLIAGSSMGGLISYYAILKHPDVFGKAGIFSPSFWIAPQFNNLTDSIGDKVTGKIFFYIGGQEGDTPPIYLAQMKAIENRLAKKSKTVIYSVIDPDGKHNEKAWRKWFPVFYKWIMAE
jgi:predicted alpha/beta superfamily hydrolase